MADLIRIERDGPLTVVTLDSPPLNLFDRPMFDALRVTADALGRDPGRAVLLRAEGRAVSAGVDVNEFDGLSVQGGDELWSELIATLQRFEALPVPTVFAAHALCLTAAFELALTCDILLAADSARFGLVERVVGLTPSMGGPQRLAHRAGPARARELIYTGGVFDAATLERWNVVNRVLPDEGFDDAARAFAMDLATGPTHAHAATKAIVRIAVEDSVEEADRRTPAISGALFGTADLQSAVRSFLADGPGKATFEGR